MLIANKNVHLLFIVSLVTFSPFFEKKVTIANTSVKSATFPPNKVPSPISGWDFSADEMDMNVSGRIEMTDTIKNPTTYFDSFNPSAICEENLIANPPLLIRRIRETMNVIMLSMI